MRCATGGVALERIVGNPQITGLNQPTLPGAQLIVLSEHVLAANSLDEAATLLK
jgi:hypothetical protein